MKLFVRGLFASALLFACLIFTGCDSLPGTDQTGAGGNPPATQVARFQIGDTVSVTFDGPDQKPPHEEQIKEDGTITLDLIGKVQAVGKTAGELQNEIHDLYVPKYYVRLTVNVKPGDLVYYVSGEVKGAGRQLYVGSTTVTKAVTSAGGLTDFARHKVWLTRANGQRIEVDYDEALQDQSKDPQVYPADQINVPRKLF
jgi:protein involved in polysaccharide export with SLBB domain